MKANKSSDKKLIPLTKVDDNSVTCHHCGASDYRRKGFDKGRRQYYCKNCKRHFIPGIKELTNLDCIKLGLQCPECGNNQCWKAGKTKDGRQRYRCKKCNRSFNLNPMHGKYEKDLPLSDDVWLASDLGVATPKHRSLTKLIFVYIEQQWLKDIAKKFIRYMASNRSFQTLSGYISELNGLSEFIAEKYSFLNGIHEIDRQFIVDYLEYLSERLSSSTKAHRLSMLNTLFNVGTANQWFELPAGLILREDFPKHNRPLPRYIPEEVMQQLNQHLDALPEQIMRMVLVIQECGLRVSELLNLPINCLRQDAKGDWYIQFMRGKIKCETTLPISQELAAVIQEQKQYIRDSFDNKTFNYLFCAKKQEPPGYRHRFRPKPKVMYDKSFISYLKNLAEEFNICDNSGQPWIFQSHQFRHTVGTRMINNEVPHHIIQRYLGHTSPTMTSVYAHIHDKTLKQEIAKYHDSRVVNVAGEVVESTTPELDNDLDLHLLKKKVLAQSLPNGSCARPIVLGEFPHANACLTCSDFRTTLEFLDQHKAHLIETEKLVKNAEEKGWKRHAEMNTKVRNNLNKIITTLESGNKDIVSGGDE
ncbi:MAG: tyrosine-type recombinase/integrase [Xenococcaceae cyanobacterium MO_167.B27]|nr:tyrosine-type recombinase/integrase [Xenococcaceae cyanobacterium MO_167.B27]